MARHLDGTTGYLQAMSTLIAGVPLSWSLWIKFDDTGTPPSNQGVIASLTHFNSTGFWDGFVIDYNYIGGGVSAWQIVNDFTDYGYAQGASPPPGVWTHVCCVFASHSSRRFYYNGVLEASDTAAVAAPSTVLDVFTVGSVNDLTAVATSPVAATIADVGLWSKALSDAEVALVFGSHPSAVPASLRGYWPIAGSASPEPNVSGDFPALTVVGSAVQAPDPPYECPSVITMTAAYIVRVV